MMQFHADFTSTYCLLTIFDANKTKVLDPDISPDIFPASKS